jgi:hypothetical protein
MKIVNSQYPAARAHLTFAEPPFSPGAENKRTTIKTTPRRKRIATANAHKGEKDRSWYACLEFILPALKAAMRVE